MATTFRDVLLECELYPFSQEHFDLMRECSEVDLMNTYLARHDFLAEAKDLDLNLGSLATESYFGESADESELELIQESVGSKLKNIVKKIWKGVCKIFRALGKFLGLCGATLEQQQSDIESIFKQPVPSGKTNTDEYHFFWTADAIKKLEPIVDKYTGQNGVVEFPEQTGGLNVKYDYEDAKLKSQVKQLDGAFRAALAFNGTVVTIRPKIQAATFDQAVEIANKLKDPKSLTASDNVQDFMDQFQNVIGLSDRTKAGKAAGKQEYFKVKIDATYFRDTSKALTDAATAMEAATDQLKLVSQKENGPNKGNEATRERRGRAAAAFYNDNTESAAGIGGNAATKLHQQYTDINLFVGNTLKVFNAYMSFRKDVIKAYGSKAVGTMRTAAPEKVKDLSGKEHKTAAGEAITQDDINKGGDTKDVKDAKGAKGYKA